MVPGLPSDSSVSAFELAPGHRGIPPGKGSFSSSAIAEAGWHPAGGLMNLPLLSMDLGAYEDNKRVMFGLCRHMGCEIAPHLKTPMAPFLAHGLFAGGAWAISVADLRQAEVMLSHGIRKILIANEIGGRAAASRLGDLIEANPAAEVLLFVDSPHLVQALISRWGRNPDLPKLQLLIDIGCGRGGVNSNEELEELLASFIPGSAQIELAGVAAYEGTANRPQGGELADSLDDLFSRVAYAMEAVRKRVGNHRRLILSMGGSSLFDHVITRSRPILAQDPDAFLLLRSGSCFFSDHGNMPIRFGAMVERGLLPEQELQTIGAGFKPALRLWAEVLSDNGHGYVICGFGMRDVAHDQGLPKPLALWRDGERVANLDEGNSVLKLNDQHAFISISNYRILVGDVVELGIKHPCTTLDKHRVIYGLNNQGFVEQAIPTFFG